MGSFAVIPSKGGWTTCIRMPDQAAMQNAIASAAVSAWPTLLHRKIRSHTLCRDAALRLTMIRPDRDPPEPTSMSWTAWGPALSAALLIVALGGLTTYLALKFDALRPRVGDMIVFAPTPADSDSWQLLVATTSVAGRDQAAGPCVFDPNVMSVSGGSLIVEERQATSPPLFQLHWAGRHTAKGAGDCGETADLTLDRYDLQRLANAAGGFGVRPTALR